ncbi:Hemicentin-1 [Stylophora pistillata]|uniref:Hemicentin-1 n=1 Tax=Stylophora pistillata TaxID=50429 RepID=A0A2B4RQX6_STYPI|nr:Hemicentin-1 [Stylophora pistillata]
MGPGVGALRPKITEVDKAVVARKGSTVTLLCLATRVNRRKTVFSWEFNGQELKSSNKPHYWTAERKGNISLNIKNVSDNDVGTYTCKVYNLHGAKMLEAKENIELSLQEEVLKVTSTQTNITLDEGSTTNLHCRVTSSKAFITDVYWLFNGKVVAKPEALHHKVNGVSLANEVERLSYSLELKHVTLAKSGIYTCSANSTIGLQKHDIAVSVHRTNGPDLLLIKKTKRYVEIVEGTNVTLSCLGIYPDASFDHASWLFNGSQIKTNKHFKVNNGFVEKKGNIKRKLLSLTMYNAGLEDSGNYACVLNTSHGLQRKNIKVYVTFFQAPNVTSTQTNITLGEGSTTTLDCSVIFSEAFPMVVYWLFNGKILTKPKAFHHEVSGVSLVNKVKRYSFPLELKHVTLAQSGIYTCGANFTTGLQTHDIAVSVNRTQGPHLQLRKKTKPYVEITNGTNVTLSCLGIYPAASFDDAFWLFNGSQIKSNKYFEVNNGFVETKEENIKRKLLSLTIYNAQLEDSGNYSCVLNTSHGLRRKHIKVNVTFSRVLTPEPPEYVLQGDKHFKQVLYISLGLFTGVVTTIGILVKLWYQRGPKLPPSIKPCPDEELIFKYDVFVTYSRRDSEWVNSELLSLLSKNQVNYCIDKLHFKLGHPILNSITDSVYQSRYVLAVWSRSYAASKFCKQELDYALQKSFHCSDYSVILIGLESINPKTLPKPLRARTFLNYSDSVDREGWEKRLIKHLKGSANNKFAHVLGTVV